MDERLRCGLRRWRETFERPRRASPPRWPGAAALERATQQRYFATLFGVGVIAAGAVGLVFAARQQWALALGSAAVVSIALACGLWAWRGRRVEWPMRLLSAALIVALGWHALRQGPALPAAGWWLSALPFVCAGAGLYGMAAASLMLFVGIVGFLVLGPGPTTAVDAVEPLRQFAAVVGSELVTLGLLVTAMRRHRAAVGELEAARAAAIEAMEAKSRFLAHMSHEIRTPLNGVIGTAELLRSPQIDEPQRAQLLGLQEQSARTLLALLNDVLDWARLEAGKVALEARPLNLRRLVFEANELFAVQAYNKGIDLTSSCNPDVPRRFLGDATRLRQIIDNLVGNAVKFTSSGGVHIHLSLEPASAAAGPATGTPCWVRVEVVDSGIGIEAQRLRTLFAAFMQADASVTRRYGGSGLGLAISLELARLMGGRIDVTSAPGRGSSFALLVPLRLADRSLRVPALRLRDDVLLASASPGVQRHLKTILHDLGIEPRVSRRLPPVPEPGDTRVLLVDAPLLAALPDPCAWLQRQARGRRRVVVITPLGADLAIGTHADVLLLYKPVRRRSLKAVLDAIEGGATGAPAPCQFAPTRPAAGPHVLVAEDNTVNRIVVQAMLTELGATSVVATHGREALDCLAAERFDLVLMDMEMPEMDGLAATRAWRAAEAERGAGRRVPVIAMTAHSAAEAARACQGCGMDGVLTKPFGMADLRSVLERWAPVGGAVAPLHAG